MSVIFYWITYIVTGCCVYTLFRGTYVRTKVYNNYRFEWEETNERYKYPLWFILLVSLIYLIPMVNLLIPLVMCMDAFMNEDRKKYYYKSFLTKRY